jgi:hypothetical protein
MAKIIKPAQRIVDIICQRFAQKLGTTLPPKYWKDDRFARHYALQIITANALLKTYSVEAIVAALNCPQGDRIWSLKAAWLDPIIAIEQKKIDVLNQKKEEYFKNKELTEAKDTKIPFEPIEYKTNKKSKVSLLEKLDE